MNKDIKGLLIYPPNQLMDIETPRPDGSLGPLYLASSLENHGIKTDILDASVGSPNHSLEKTFYNLKRQENGLIRIGMDFDEIGEYVANGNYSFVGISSNFTPQTKMAFETAKAIKKSSPEIKVYAGGVNARALKERFLNTGYFEGVCLTEGEIIFSQAILQGVGKTPGWAYIKTNREIKINPVTSECFPEKIDNLPMPAWNKLPFNKYMQIASPHGVDVTNTPHQTYAPIMTSRGCRFNCTYCHISNEKKDIGKLRQHSLERVIRETEILNQLEIKKLFFEDDTLLARKQRAKKIFQKVQDRCMLISNVNGVNLIDFYIQKLGSWEVDKEFISILKSAGFNQLVFPVESGCQRILDKYASGKVQLDKMDIPFLMESLTKAGILAPVNMMIGFPDETEQEIQKSIDLSKKLIDYGAPYVTFFIPIPFPGSKLHEIAIGNNYLARDFDTDLLNWKRPIMQNTTISPKRLEEIRDNATEQINTSQHLEKRLKQSAGHRWSSK